MLTAKRLRCYAEHLRNESDNKMDQGASIDGLGLLIEITCCRAEDSSAEHHGDIVAHVEYEIFHSRSNSSV